MFLLETGTAMTLFCDTDLFLSVALLLGTRQIDVGSVRRRVLFLPSGWLLLVGGKLDINLLVGLRSSLCLAFPIR